jgi:hypothetical protein
MRFVLAVLALLPPGAEASAQDLAALVSDASDATPKLAQDDVLSVGAQFDLGTDGTVTLTYLNSCNLESIVGGHVTIGTEQSTVTGGKVTLQKLNCFNADEPLSAPGNGEAGGAFSRDPFADPVVQSTQPIFIASQSSLRAKTTFVIQRLDSDEKPIERHAEGAVLDLMRCEVA